MMSCDTKRQLIVILAADMAGYSRLVELDETGVLNRQRHHRLELIDPTIAEHGGTIVKTTGDGVIVAFDNVLDAVQAALAIQKAMPAREMEVPEAHRILYRIGINLGDVVLEDGDVFGDAVNVAARLETLAKPGGICVADLVHQIVAERLDARFADLGPQRVKNIQRHLRVWQWVPEMPEDAEPSATLPSTQEVRFCTAADGVQLAYARIGRGPRVVKAPNWVNHLEYEWRSPVWGPVLRSFAERAELLRFDQRGNGLSDWDVDDISEDAMIGDLATVVDTAGFDRFALFGISQGCAFAIRYAVEHPERVGCLILLGGYMRGRLKRRSPEHERWHELSLMMIRQGWGSPNREFRHFFSESFMPDATPEQKANFDELQRITITPENALRILEMNANVDVSHLAPLVQVPTLVLHCRDDRMAPLAEGRRMAATIPNARFVQMEGANHALIEGSPAFEQFFAEVDGFLGEHMRS